MRLKNKQLTVIHLMTHKRRAISTNQLTTPIVRAPRERDITEEDDLNKPEAPDGDDQETKSTGNFKRKQTHKHMEIRGNQVQRLVHLMRLGPMTFQI